MVCLFTEQISPRLQYIAGILFENILGIECRMVTDRHFFLEQSGICINYSTQVLGHGIQIIPQGLLFEKDIHRIPDLTPGEWEGLFCFFCQKKGEVPFDLLAASFYLLSRYEEYFPIRLDEHDRFRPEESLAHSAHFLEIPQVDLWMYKLKDLLVESGCDENLFKRRKYSVVSTFDIDHPFLYRNKGVLKNLYGIGRELQKGDFRAIRERLSVLFHFREDPYLEVLHFIDSIQKTLGQSYYLFVLLAERGKYGRTTVYPQRRYFRYLRSLTGVQIGLHASYPTLFQEERLKKEKKKLERLLHRSVSLNRQHFLRLQWPKTFENLSEAGIEEDFSLAYARKPGFRSSTAIPYRFYDFKQEKAGAVLIRPTVVMDSCLITHLGLSPAEALDKLKTLAEQCCSVGGDFLMLWHNSNLAGTPEENPWINVFIEAYQYALSLENDNFAFKK